jgi:hypothetical protein
VFRIADRIAVIHQAGIRFGTLTSPRGDDDYGAPSSPPGAPCTRYDENLSAGPVGILR